MSDWSDVPLEQLTAAVAGTDLWNAPGVPDRIAPLRVTDGPNGARGPSFTGVPSACFPCGSALGATWDPELVTRVGAAIGEEARTKRAQVLLAPTVNLHRHPLAGRNFECYSEDPYLTARLAVGFVRGVQSVGVGTTVKHFVANDSEFERMTISSDVDESVLRELYLVPFEAAVTEAGAWGVMSAYNRLNGTYCSEHEWLLTTVLRDDWGFDGFVVSDWFGTHSTAPAATAGLDLEMPGPPQWFGTALTAAVEQGVVDRATVERMVERLAVLAERTGAAEVVDREPGSVDDPAHRALIREAAAASFVLLRNEGALLPLDRSTLRRVAVVGAAADSAWIMGGGSAALDPHPPVRPRAGIAAALGADTELVFSRGPAATDTIPVLDAGALDGRLTLEVFASTDCTGDPVITSSLRAARGTVARRLQRRPRPDAVLRAAPRDGARRRGGSLDVRSDGHGLLPGPPRRGAPRRRVGAHRTRVPPSSASVGPSCAPPGTSRPDGTTRSRSSSRVDPGRWSAGSSWAPHRRRPRTRSSAPSPPRATRTSRSWWSAPGRRWTPRGRTGRRWHSPGTRTRSSGRSPPPTRARSCASTPAPRSRWTGPTTWARSSSAGCRARSGATRSPTCSSARGIPAAGSRRPSPCGSRTLRRTPPIPARTVASRTPTVC